MDHTLRYKPDGRVWRFYVAFVPPGAEAGRVAGRVAMACATDSKCTPGVEALLLGDFNQEHLGWADPLAGVPRSKAAARIQQIDWAVLKRLGRWVGTTVRLDCGLGLPVYGARWLSGAGGSVRRAAWDRGGTRITQGHDLSDLACSRSMEVSRMAGPKCGVRVCRNFGRKAGREASGSHSRIVVRRAIQQTPRSALRASDLAHQARRRGSAEVGGGWAAVG